MRMTIKYGVPAQIPKDESLSEFVKDPDVVPVGKMVEIEETVEFVNGVQSPSQGPYNYPRYQWSF